MTYTGLNISIITLALVTLSAGHSSVENGQVIGVFDDKTLGQIFSAVMIQNLSSYQ